MSPPVRTKTRTTGLIYVPSSLDSVRIGSKVTTLPPTLSTKAAGQDKVTRNQKLPVYYNRRLFSNIQAFDTKLIPFRTESPKYNV
ncbi:hypothetical protein DPMN_180654 [Dreissena polymorpha]|uniref:Uncharacterized protein n=1 Tax=Dreissena polymorpha TaxID=45954 RepID=A0A9D4EJF8_DREPO|nr:hypothetical protein DPMN_180654 [Dreissena polymorpha]